MLGLNRVGTKLRSLVTCEEDNPARLLSVAFEHLIPYKRFRIAVRLANTHIQENRPHYNRLGDDSKKLVFLVVVTSK
jgi:hypothetical protein